jgi:hypothetical protein
LVPLQHRQEVPECLRHCCRDASTSITPACTAGVTSISVAPTYTVDIVVALSVHCSIVRH